LTPSDPGRTVEISMTRADTPSILVFSIARSRAH